MKCVMVDLETLSTRLDTKIVSIGACTFDRTAIAFSVDERLSAVTTLSDQDGHLSDDTLGWWMKQSDAARAVFNCQKVPLCDALRLLRNVTHNADEIWSNGANFDIPIIEWSAYRMGIEGLWNYKATRCYRTLNAMHPLPVRLEFEGVQHEALADAVYQARVVHAITASLTAQNSLARRAF